MQFVQKHLTKHHLTHAPHKWFLAFLVSPLHAAQIHYQNKYHLNFRHAKKLFFFDMCLLGFILFLFGATTFWFFYDPTVRSLVSLKVEQSEERITTGSVMRYNISYINRSDVALISPILSVEFPAGFIISTSTSDHSFKTENSSFTLDDLAPGANGTFILEGTLFGTPDQDYDTIVRLSYVQEGEKDREHVVSRIISAPRDTPILVNWEVSEFILSEGSVPFTLELKNTATQNLSTITLPFSNSSEIKFEQVTSTLGVYTGNLWTIPSLASNQSTTLTGNLITNLPPNTKTQTLEIIPSLKANNTQFPQEKITKQFKILSPKIQAQAEWKKETGKPLERVPLSFRIKNTNDYPLENIVINVPLSSSIDKVRMGQNTLGFVKNNNFVINKTTFNKLGKLQQGETLEFEIMIPLSAYQSGTDVTLKLEPQFTADIPLVPGALYRYKAQTSSLKIATGLGIKAELRYYTTEGDQLGRGPLPPRVGNETKYFATLVLSNTTGQAENVTVSATLPPGVEWGNRTSVTFGKDVIYNPQNKKISWNAPLVGPHTSIGISFALSFTPTFDMIGKTIPALSNITVSGADIFTKEMLSARTSDIDTSLPSDDIGKTKGVHVVE